MTGYLARGGGIRPHPIALTAAPAIAMLVGTVLAVQPPAPQVPAGDPVPLTTATAIVGELSGSRLDRYQVELRQGDLAIVSVEQRGIDVEVQLLGVDGTPVLRVHDAFTPGSEERLEFVAGAAGPHVVQVGGAYPRAPAGAYRIRLSEVRAADARDRILHEARTLRSAALHLMVQGERAEAARVAEQALAVAERVLDPDDRYVGLAAATAGFARAEVWDAAAAQRHHTRAFEVLSARLGADHPQTTLAQAGLGTAHKELGDYASAERLLQDALRRQERIFPAGHPVMATTLINLANLSTDRGDTAGAARVLQRAAAIGLAWLGEDSEQYAIIQNNLGVIYIRQRDYQRAEPHLRRSVAIREKLLGADHPELASALNNLGIIAREMQDYASAERYYARVLAIREQSVGMEHPSVAGTLNNLANVYSAQGDYKRSLALLLRALAIDEKHATPWRQPILALGNIARRYAALGDVANAFRFQSRVDAALESDIALNLAIGSERQKIAYLSSVAERTDRTVSFHLGMQPANQEAARLAARVLLQRKGRVLDAMADTLAAIRVHAGDEERSLLGRLADTTTRFAQLALAGPGRTPADEHRRTLEQLDEAREKLEIEVGQRSDEFRASAQRVTLEDVQSALPDGTALLEFAVYRPFDPKAASNAVAYGPARYAVYVVRRDAVAGHDLGAAAAIDASIAAFRAAVQDPRRDDLTRVARALDRRIMQPVRTAAAGATRFLISPDGQLSLIPFEALVDERGRYLVERYPIGYLSAGRDVLRLQFARASRSAPLVLADPLFGEPAATAGRPGSAAGTAAAAAAGRRSVTTGADVSSMYFAPLAGTLREAQGIRSVFDDAQILSGAQATESALKGVRAPRILHIATHGFFLEARSDAAAPATRATPAAPAGVENPLLRSGLALAGANLAARSDDGILTALEAAHLNLWGTKLVILSACDTGIGVVRNGDGVYGLRRSIFLAGAESLVMSLWPVSDYITREMMTAYYQGLKNGLGRGEALRQVQLAMLKRKGREHPFYWASFIQAGEWANLQGQR